MSELFLYDDATARAFEPFALTRPTCELRAGALLLRERWEHALGMRASGFVSAAHLSDFEEPWGISAAMGVLRAGSVLANARCAVALSPTATADVWRCNHRIAAMILHRDLDADELANGEVSLEKLFGDARMPVSRERRTVEIQGRWLDHVWDFIAHLVPMLTEDISALGASAARSGSTLGSVSGRHGVFAEDGATIEPHVYFDATTGPVLVRRGATVQAFTRVVGPCVVGTESIVGGDKITAAAIGDTCKVHGEVNTVIFLGHCNKSHDGFVGHSYLGRWVNLGAGTVTSNMKNTYGSVHLWTPEGLRDTGQQFLGTLFGDHAKTGIGTPLNTGTVVGAGANVYGGAMPAKAIPPFAWGERPPYSTYRMDKFAEVARRMMARRHVELSARQVRLLTAAFEQRWTADSVDETR